VAGVGMRIQKAFVVRRVLVRILLSGWDVGHGDSGSQ
jgi:hypothetical protein